MRFRITLVAFLLVALAGVRSPAWSANPSLSLRAANVTLAEAAALLEREAGVPVEVRIFRGDGLPPPSVDPERRFSFAWSRTTLGQALRELAERYDLHLAARPGGGYALMSRLGAPPLQPYRLAGAVERGGFRIGVRSLAIQRRRSEAPSGSLSAVLWAESVGGDVETIAGIENLTARDSRGGILISSPGASRAEVLPDGWGRFFQLDPPDPRARRLQWIEGDLVLFRRLRPLRVEIPLPLPAGGARHQAGNVEIDVQRLLPGTAEATSQLERQRSGPTVQARLRFPVGLALQSAGVGGEPAPLLVGRSGRTYAPYGIAFSARLEDEETVDRDYSYRYAAIDEPLSSLRFQLVEKDGPERRLPFRLQNLPLPPEDGLGPAPPQWVFRAGKLGPGSRFYSQPGGELSSRVLSADRKAFPGTLSVGLSAVGADAEPGIEWYQVEVGSDGTARLPHLRPGTYRVLRIYRPADAARNRLGWWKNGETRVTVTAGARVSLPPLEWLPAAAGGIPGGKPPRR